MSLRPHVLILCCLAGCPAPEAETPESRDARLEATYSEAAASAGQPAGYGEALRLFAEIPREHELGPDAAAYVEWIESGVDFRTAKAVFDAGHLRRALGLAYQFDRRWRGRRFGDRRSLAVMWVGQVRACRIGLEAAQEGDLAIAQRAFSSARYGASQALRNLVTAHLDTARVGSADDRSWRPLERRLLSLDWAWLEDLAGPELRTFEDDEAPPRPPPPPPPPPDGPAAWGDWHPAWERQDGSCVDAGGSD